MKFDWDDKKNAANIKKHGISFEEAAEVFDDPLHISLLDVRFDYNEERWITIGTTLNGKIIVIGHLYFLRDNDEEHIRIITARIATKKERKRYETL
jgi:uncharacterized DUF497 family protein